jgi:hypothetical protein
LPEAEQTHFSTEICIFTTKSDDKSRNDFIQKTDRILYVLVNKKGSIQNHIVYK